MGHNFKVASESEDSKAAARMRKVGKKDDSSPKVQCTRTFYDAVFFQLVCCDWTSSTKKGDLYFVFKFLSTLQMFFYSHLKKKLLHCPFFLSGIFFWREEDEYITVFSVNVCKQEIPEGKEMKLEWNERGNKNTRKEEKEKQKQHSRIWNGVLSLIQRAVFLPFSKILILKYPFSKHFTDILIHKF